MRLLPLSVAAVRTSPAIAAEPAFNRPNGAIWYVRHDGSFRPFLHDTGLPPHCRRPAGRDVVHDAMFAFHAFRPGRV